VRQPAIPRIEPPADITKSRLFMSSQFHESVPYPNRYRLRHRATARRFSLEPPSQPVVKVQTVARMGIVRRAQGATPKAIPVWIVEEEQRRDRPHSGPCNLRQTDDGRAQQDPCALRA